MTRSKVNDLRKIKVRSGRSLFCWFTWISIASRLRPWTGALLAGSWGAHCTVTSINLFRFSSPRFYCRSFVYNFWLWTIFFPHKNTHFFHEFPIYFFSIFFSTRKKTIRIASSFFFLIQFSKYHVWHHLTPTRGVVLSWDLVPWGNVEVVLVVKQGASVKVVAVKVVEMEDQNFP